jgi:hypothetical protein
MPPLEGLGRFCANPRCPLHVATGNPQVRGCGQWAEIDGVLYDRHPLEPGGPYYCSACRKAMPQ